jgi:hypothetical protein
VLKEVLTPHLVLFAFLPTCFVKGSTFQKLNTFFLFLLHFFLFNLTIAAAEAEDDEYDINEDGKCVCRCVCVSVFVLMSICRQLCVLMIGLCVTPSRNSQYIV